MTNRTVQQIEAEISAIQASDRAYNRVVNEGGEGFARNTMRAELWAELADAKKAAFAAEWTFAVWTERRAAWNAEVAKFGARVSDAQIAALIKRMGYSHHDLRNAKALHTAG